MAESILLLFRLNDFRSLVDRFRILFSPGCVYTTFFAEHFRMSCKPHSSVFYFLSSFFFTLSSYNPITILDLSPNSMESLLTFHSSRLSDCYALPESFPFHPRGSAYHTVVPSLVPTFSMFCCLPFFNCERPAPGGSRLTGDPFGTFPFPLSPFGFALVYRCPAFRFFICKAHPFLPLS